MAFAGHYIFALCVVAMMLAALYAASRALKRVGPLRASSERLISVVESTGLAQNAMLYLVRVANRYFFIGSANGRLQTLAEIAQSDIAGERSKST